MKYAVNWNQEQRAIAKEQGKALLGVGIDGNGLGGTGRYEHYGPCDIDTARFVFFFSNTLQNLKSKATEADFRRVFEKTLDDLKLSTRTKPKAKKTKRK